MVVAIELEDALAPGVPAGDPDGAHRGLGARVSHPDHLHRGADLTDQLRQLDLQLRRSPKGCPVPDRPFQGFHYLRVGVAEDQGTVTHDVVHVGVAVHVEYTRALPASHEQGIPTDRSESPDRTVDASGETMHRPLHQACGAVHRQRCPSVYAIAATTQPS